MKGINTVRDLLEKMEEHKSVRIMDEWGENEKTYNSVKEALEADDIYMAMGVDGFRDSSYFNGTDIDIWAIFRVCSECGEPMIEGYIVGDGDTYYCSDECLHKHYTDEEWDEMYENYEGYYTEW